MLGPAVPALREDARMADAAVRMDSKSFRAMSSFQAGSYKVVLTKVQTVRVSDFIGRARFHATRYRSRHDTVVVPTGSPILVQVTDILCGKPHRTAGTKH